MKRTLKRELNKGLKLLKRKQSKTMKRFEGGVKSAMNEWG